MLAQRREQIVGDRGRRTADRDRVVEHQPLELVERVTVAVMGESEKLLLGDARVERERGGDVAAELAVHERRGLRLREHLQALLHAVLARGGLLERAEAEHQDGCVGVHLGRLQIAAEFAPYRSVGEAHDRVACLGGDALNAAHELLPSVARLAARHR